MDGRGLSGDGPGARSALRVFISYSHEDLDLVKRLVGILEDNGLRPMWDEQFVVGPSFSEQIKTYIAHAHVFMPVITESSSGRGWVHQEIGYAMALNVPVLPVASGALPRMMLEGLKALVLDPILGDDDKLHQKLSYEAFHDLAETRNDKSYALYSCADEPPQRAQMMARYADDVRSMGEYGCVRQKGALSSLHIPKETVDNSIWRQRYGGFDRGTFHCEHQRNERLALEKHAREEGCRIIIDPSITYEQWGPHARRVRLATLVRFLDSMPDEKAQVAINENMARARSLTIVGDWFAAESVSGSILEGYKQTIFTRHAPSVASRVEVFDAEFNELLSNAGWTAETSRSLAIEELNTLIKKIDEDAGVR